MEEGGIVTETYRGTVEVRTTLKDQYGNNISGRRILHTKTYNKIGVARGQATTRSGRYPINDVLDKYTERVVSWERID